MPNHVKTTCTVSGPAASISAFKARMFRRGEEEGTILFDFEGILPMPACVRATEMENEFGLIVLGEAEEGVAERLLAFPWVRAAGIRTVEELKALITRSRPEAVKAALANVKARAETGYADWHSWSCATWGTKWNAYRCSVGSDEDGSLSFAFFTAWEFPEPVFVALAAAFPELVFQCACFEDAGDFAGQGEFNGASDFALCGVTAEIYELVLGDGRMRAA